MSDKNDLLRRQDCIEAIEGIACSMSVCVNADECHGMKRMQRQAVLEIANMPAVQPEIIRCKDCKHRHVENMVWTCPFGLPGGENFFCGYGIRGNDMDDLISRQAAIELIENESRKWGDEYGVSDVLCDLADLPAAQPEKRTNKSTKTHACDCVSRQAAIDEIRKWKRYETTEGLAERIENLPSAQPDDWMERNKERILQAGMEGREIEFRIGGRLFAIREKAQ